METGQWEAGWRVWSGLLTVGHVLSWQTDAWKEQTVHPAEEKTQTDTKKKKKKEKVKLGSIIISSEWKVLGIITTQMEYSKRHTISRTATIMSYSTLLWAKKRLKIMRRESGCCVLSSIPLTGQGKFLFLVAIRTDRMVGVVRVQNSRAIMWNILWERGWGSLCCCDCQSDGKELTSLLLRPAAHCFYTQQDSQSPQLFRRNKVEKCSNISYLNQLFVHVMC